MVTFVQRHINTTYYFIITFYHITYYKGVTKRKTKPFLGQQVFDQFFFKLFSPLRLLLDPSKHN
jgi:hypothetical protein